MKNDLDCEIFYDDNFVYLERKHKLDQINIKNLFLLDQTIQHIEIGKVYIQG
jgi:hypothetical protein